MSVPERVRVCLARVFLLQPTSRRTFTLITGMNEAFRIKAPATMVSREAIEDCEIPVKGTGKNAETIKIKPNSVHTVDVALDAPALVGWQLQLTGSNKHIEFKIVRVLDDAKVDSDEGKHVILPKRKVLCSNLRVHFRLPFGFSSGCG